MLTPKNWTTFQHYHDRRPPWIKLHKSLLDDIDYLCLPDASKALAPFLWLLASEYQDGQISLSMPKLAMRLRMSEDKLAEALKPLIEQGFFVASDMLANMEQYARLDREETEREKEKYYPVNGAPVSSSPAKPRKRGVRLSVIKTPEDQTAFESLWQAWPREREGNPARGEKPKAEACWQAILDGGEVSSSELLASGLIYIHEDSRVQAGFPKMVSTFLSAKDGLWRRGVEISRQRAAKMLVSA